MLNGNHKYVQRCLSLTELHLFSIYIARLVSGSCTLTSLLKLLHYALKVHCNTAKNFD